MIEPCVYHCYRGRPPKRVCEIHWGRLSIWCEPRPRPEPSTAVFSWTNYRKPPAGASACVDRVVLIVSLSATGRLRGRGNVEWDGEPPAGTRMFPSSTNGPIRVKAPKADWAELFALSRTVAHRREPYPLLGWVEDRLPDPWCRLASPDPIDAIKALCPYPVRDGV